MTPPRKPSVAVIGAGIVGLTSAIRLAEVGHAVRVLSREEPLSTTSANAGAIWGPFLSVIDARLAAWSFQTLATLREHARIPGSGVTILNGTGVERGHDASPWWVGSFEDSTPCATARLPAGYSRGWTYRVPIIDMPVYLQHLVDQLRELGSGIELVEVSSLEEALDDDTRYVAVCAGMGSCELVGDTELIPSKGQLVVVENPGLTEFFAERGDGPDLTYILPQGSQAVLGGTAEWDFDNSDADVETCDRILSRCAAVEPRLLGVRVLGMRAGLRACRPTVRLAHVAAPGHHAFYNYGHGGSGVSVSWGCADSLAALVTCWMAKH